MNTVIGLDLGGTKLRAGLINAQGEVLDTLTLPTITDRGREGILNLLLEACQSLQERAKAQGLGVSGVGLSTAGVVDTARGVITDATPNLPQWKGTEVGPWLSQRLELPVAADNDVKAALLGEQWLGGARGEHSVVMLTLGTGLGGAQIENGQLLRGRNGRTGHWGCMKMQHPNRPGEWVLVETYLSGNGLLRLVNEHLQVQGSERRFSDGRRVMDAYANRDPEVAPAVEQFLELLAHTLDNISWAVDPALILLGGGMINSRQVWWRALEQRLAGLGTPLTIRPATLDNDAGMFGAARLAFDRAAITVNTGE